MHFFSFAVCRVNNHIHSNLRLTALVRNLHTVANKWQRQLRPKNGLFHYVACWELQVGPGNHHALTMLHLSNWSECVTHLWATAFVNLDADSRTNYKPSSREESTCSLWTKSTAGRTIATWTTGIMASYWHNQNIIQKPCYAAYLVLRHTSAHIISDVRVYGAQVLRMLKHLPNVSKWHSNGTTMMRHLLM